MTFLGGFSVWFCLTRKKQFWHKIHPNFLTFEQVPISKLFTPPWGLATACRRYRHDKHGPGAHISFASLNPNGPIPIFLQVSSRRLSSAKKTCTCNLPALANSYRSRTWPVPLRVLISVVLTVLVSFVWFLRSVGVCLTISTRIAWHWREWYLKKYIGAGVRVGFISLWSKRWGWKLDHSEKPEVGFFSSSDIDFRRTVS